MVYIVINLQEISFTVKCPLDYTGGCCVFFVPLWITFDATSFPSSQTGGFSSFHPQSRLSLVGVNQNYFSWSASTVPTPSSVYSSAGIELTASCFSGGIELYHSSHSRVSSDNHIIPLPYISLIICIFKFLPAFYSLILDASTV